MVTDQETLLNALQNEGIRVLFTNMLNSMFIGYQSYDELPERIKSKLDRVSWNAIFKLHPDEMTPCSKLRYIINKTGKSLSTMIEEQELLFHWHGHQMEIVRAEFWNPNKLEIHLYNDYGKDFIELFSESYGCREISDLILGKEVKVGLQGPMYFCDGKGFPQPLNFRQYE